MNAGVYQWLVPQAYGGSELPYETYIQQLRKLARQNASQAVSISVHHSVCVVPIVKYGSPAQQQTWLPQLAEGPRLGAFALTEANSGSDATAARLKAVPIPTGYRLSGEKIFITNAMEALAFIVFAQLEGKLTGFILPHPWPGLSILPGDAKLGLKESTWGTLQLDDVLLPADQLLGQPGQGFVIARDVLVGGRIGIAAIAMGLTDRCLGYWEQQSLSVVQQDRLAHWHTQRQAAELLLNQATTERASGRDATLSASMAKAFASQTAFALAQETVETFNLGLYADHPVTVAWADAKAMEIVEGTSEIQRIIISKQLLS